MTLAALFLLVGCGAADETPTPAPAPVVAPAPPPVEPPPEPPAAPAEPAAADAAAGAAGNVEAGKTVYTTYCQACHQADGTGMGGMLAGDFVKDKERLQKSDEELLTSIRDGVTGGTSVMPPWGASLSEEQMVDVLAYIRATYGG